MTDTKQKVITEFKNLKIKNLLFNQILSQKMQTKLIGKQFFQQKE